MCRVCVSLWSWCVRVVWCRTLKTRVYIQNVPVCTGTTPACGEESKGEIDRFDHACLVHDFLDNNDLLRKQQPTLVQARRQTTRRSRSTQELTAQPALTLWICACNVVVPCHVLPHRAPRPSRVFRCDLPDAVLQNFIRFQRRSRFSRHAEAS